MNSTCHIIEHPIVQHKLGMLRDRTTSSADFRTIMRELSSLLAYEATRDLPTTEIKIQTPIASAKIARVSSSPLVVAILRAGNGMMDGVLSTIPFASGGHIGVYRDKFIKNTVEYYFKIPSNAIDRKILLVDPLVATADTAISCIERLKQYQVGPIKLITILIAPEGLERINYFHPDVEIYTTCIEQGLNEEGYLIPGMGDAGNRLYHTK